MKFPKKANFMRLHIVPPPREDIDERAGVCRELQRTRFLWLSVLFFSEACERIADNRFDQSDFLVPQFLEFSFAPFFRWSDCNGDLETVFMRDQLLANIGLYWFTGAIGSYFWPYYSRRHTPWQIEETRIVTVPTGYCEFPREIVRPPRSVAERTFTDIRRWSVMPRGGHFAEMEQPEALAHEIRELFRPLRSK
jgi:pimeloyl-ACP methyl ester carboxylesterase